MHAAWWSRVARVVTVPAVLLLAAKCSSNDHPGTTSPGDSLPNPPSAAALVFQAPPAAVRANDTMRTVFVGVVDAAGHADVAATTTITLAVANNPSHGALRGTTTAAAVHGVAAFPGLAIDSAGTGYTLRASATGLTNAVSDTFSVTPASAPPPPPPPPAQGNYSWTPLKVVGGHSFTAISLDQYSEHCGITAANAVWCWGPYMSGNESGTPTLFPTAFTMLATAWDYACGLGSDKYAYCWGYNGFGNLGDGTRTPRGDAVAVAGGIRFSSISAGQQTCGISLGGQLYCWGRQFSGPVGQLDSGSTTPVLIDGTRTYRQVSAGGTQTCAIAMDGMAYCMGEPGYGSDGLGTDPATGIERGSGTMQPVVGGRSFTMISAGYNHTCAITGGGAAYCWGDDGSGQLGGPAGSRGTSTEPVQVPGVPPFQAIRASGGGTPDGGWTCAIGTTDGAAWCWGATHDPNGGPTTTTPAALPGGNAFAPILSGGTISMCAVKPDGSAWCWGFNGHHQLGQGN